MDFNLILIMDFDGLSPITEDNFKKYLQMLEYTVSASNDAAAIEKCIEAIKIIESFAEIKGWE